VVPFLGVASAWGVGVCKAHVGIEPEILGEEIAEPEPVHIVNFTIFHHQLPVSMGASLEWKDNFLVDDVTLDLVWLCFSGLNREHFNTNRAYSVE